MAKGGVVGIWMDDHELVKAAAKVRDAGYKKFDAITPFPVHGLEEAIGIQRSVLPWITFFAGLVGLAGGGTRILDIGSGLAAERGRKAFFLRASIRTNYV